MALSSCSEYQSSSDNLSYTAAPLRAEKEWLACQRQQRDTCVCETRLKWIPYLLPTECHGPGFYTLLTPYQVRTQSALVASSCPCTAQQLWQLRAKIICTLRTRTYSRSVTHVRAKQLWSGDYERYHTGDSFFFWEPQSSHKVRHQTEAHVTIKHSYCHRHIQDPPKNVYTL